LLTSAVDQTVVQIVDTIVDEIADQNHAPYRNQILVGLHIVVKIVVQIVTKS